MVLITFEGIDGSGKTTIIERLKKHFQDAVFTKEPTDTPTGMAAKELSSSGLYGPLMQVSFFKTQHKEHYSNVVLPALRKEKLVISDRYFDSQWAYCILSEVYNMKQIRFEIYNEVSHEIEPALTFIFDVDVQAAIERCKSKGDDESENFLMDVKKRYLELAETNSRFVVIDANLPLDEIEKTVVEHIKKAI